MRVDRWGENVRRVIRQGWWMRVGETSFWRDKWLGDTPLKERFPRLFLVSLQKDEIVANIGFWDGMLWHWNLTWRRNLFQWELQPLDNLLTILQDASLSNGIQDKVWWKHNNRGCFTVKSFTNEFWEQSQVTNNVRGVWMGVAPPRAELLAWFVLQEKVNTRNMLRKLNLISEAEDICPFCRRGE